MLVDWPENTYSAQAVFLRAYTASEMSFTGHAANSCWSPQVSFPSSKTSATGRSLSDGFRRRHHEAGLVEYKHRRESAWEKQRHCSISTLTGKGYNDISFKITISIKHNSHIQGIRYFILDWIWVPMTQEHGFVLPQITCPYMDVATWTLKITEQNKVINHGIFKIHPRDNKLVGLLSSKEKYAAGFLWRR